MTRPCEPIYLTDFYASVFSRLRAKFEASSDGVAFICQRAALVDEIIFRLYHACFGVDCSMTGDFCLVAVGGYGRQELYPSSDIDLLFTASTERTLESHRQGIATFARNLWDLHLRVGHSARTIADCGQLHRGNLAFSVSLLDLRYLAGDIQVFELLKKAVLHLTVRDQQDLVCNLVAITAERRARHGHTIFHLEPNVKEAPGGLRDYQVARWLSLIRAMTERSAWMAGEHVWPPELRHRMGTAIQFLSATRCFLHLQQGRDDNLLSYELQEKAAAAGLGMGNAADPAAWMRQYYLQARAIESFTSRLITEVAPARSSLYSLFQDWRSRLSNADFSVIRGRILPRSLASADLSMLLSLFEMVARHALELSSAAERWVERSVQSLVREGANTGHEDNFSFFYPAVWTSLRTILGLPNAAGALRVMHRLGLLAALFPEFGAIDALVIRDFYHRYTVDEHSFMAIQNLAELRRPATKAVPDAGPAGIWKERFRELCAEIERPDLIGLALLFHDVGKGMDAPHHVAGSLEAAQKVCARLALDAADTETLLFLIGHHLEMSSTLSRRDIFDAETVGAFAGIVQTPERLKMLCLVTYADLKAVNPEALTPWRAEMLWQLYAMTSNFLSRSLDQDRLGGAEDVSISANRVLPFLEPGSSGSELKAFLEGFPRRYLSTHSPQEIAGHFLHARLLPQAAVYAKLERRTHFTELTVLTADRPWVFASITGVLSEWGMNILKADAFSNRSGIILDVFRFRDPFRTLELNPSEALRLERDIVEILTQRTALQKLMTGRIRLPQPVRVKVPTQISFDETSSSRCTLMELIAQDRPGLLYDVSSTLATLGGNIEVALIDTEAQKAIDVFYLTSQNLKLNRAQQETIRCALLEKLSPA